MLKTKEQIYNELTEELGCPLEVVFNALKEGILINNKKWWLPSCQLVYMKIDEGFYVSNAPCTDDLKYKLGKLEDLMEKYNINDLVELEIALDYYKHRYDNVQTRRIDNNE